MTQWVFSVSVCDADQKLSQTLIKPDFTTAHYAFMLNLAACVEQNGITGCSRRHVSTSLIWTRRYHAGGFPFEVCFQGSSELCKPAICAPFHSSYLGDELAHACVSLLVIISICSHLKRLANPRSHASSAPRIICVCFLTRWRDCVNLLRGEKKNRERWREKKRKKETNVLHISWKKEEDMGHLRVKYERRHKTSDRGKRRRQRKNKVKRGDLDKALFSQLCSCACWQKCPKLRLSSDKCNVWSWFRMHEIKKGLKLPRTAGRWKHTQARTPQITHTCRRGGACRGSHLNLRSLQNSRGEAPPPPFKALPSSDAQLPWCMHTYTHSLSEECMRPWVELFAWRCITYRQSCMQVS